MLDGDDAAIAALTARSAQSTVASLFQEQVRIYPDRIALDDGERLISFAELDARSRRLASVLRNRRVERGSRVAILAENRLEYFDLFFAAARLGAIAACQNWRLAAPELAHCLNLVDPTVTLVSPRHQALLAAAAGSDSEPIVFGAPYDAMVGAAAPVEPAFNLAEAEDPLLILYTSGTTGLPKGAVISHRAEVARNLVMRAEFGLAVDDSYAVWAPLYHMGGAEYSLSALMAGGKVLVIDGFDRVRLADIIATEQLGWLIVMPGMISALIGELKQRNIKPRGVKVCGVMADLVPPSEIAEITELVGAPYANTFGATETGGPPGTANLIPIGVAPTNLSKQQSRFCEIRLVDADDQEVPDGEPGELCIRGWTLFSGYWRAPEVNAHEFRGGWFHMGDVFVRNPDGTFDFVDRVKYMIKSGGENIYPAEIERVMMQDPRVAEVAVVRHADQKWGEVPIAFVAQRGDDLTADSLLERCRAELAGYKQPKGIRFIAYESFPRSASGKVQRHELEKLLTDSQLSD